MNNIKTAFVINVKYGDTVYKAGQSVELTEETYQEFLDHHIVSDRFERIEKTTKEGVRSGQRRGKKDPTLENDES